MLHTAVPLRGNAVLEMALSSLSSSLVGQGRTELNFVRPQQHPVWRHDRSIVLPPSWGPRGPCIRCVIKRTTPPRQKTRIELKEDEARAARKARRLAEKLELKAKRPQPAFMSKLMEQWTNEDVVEFATKKVQLRKEDVEKLVAHRVTGKELEFYTAEDIRRRLWIRPLAAKKLSMGIHFFPKPRQKLLLLVKVNEFGFADRSPVRVRNTRDVRKFLEFHGAVGFRRLAVGRDKRPIRDYIYLKDRREYVFVYPPPQLSTDVGSKGGGMIEAEREEEEAEMAEIYSDEASAVDDDEEDDDDDDDDDDHGQIDEEDENVTGDEQNDEDYDVIRNDEDDRHAVVGAEGTMDAMEPRQSNGDDTQVKLALDMDGAEQRGYDGAEVPDSRWPEYGDPVPRFMKDRLRGVMDERLGAAVLSVFGDVFPDMHLVPELSVIPLGPKKITKEERERDRERIAAAKEKSRSRRVRYRLLETKTKVVPKRKVPKGEDAHMVWDVVAYSEDSGIDRLPGVMVVLYRKDIGLAQDIRDADWLARTIVLRSRQENAGDWRDYVAFRGLAIIPVLAFDTVPLLEEGTLSMGSQTTGIPIFVPQTTPGPDGKVEWKLWHRSTPVENARPWVIGRYPKEKCLKVNLQAGIPLLTRHSHASQE